MPGKAAIGEPSRRVRSDGLRFRTYNLAKRGCGPKKIRAKRWVRYRQTTNHTVPYGTELALPGYQALRTWPPSFSPFLPSSSWNYGGGQVGTRNRPYQSTFSTPHHHHSAWPDSEDEDDDEDEYEYGVRSAW